MADSRPSMDTPGQDTLVLDKLKERKRRLSLMAHTRDPSIGRKWQDGGKVEVNLGYKV